MDISFPAASLIVSNTMPVHQQGVAASMVNTVINWSISFGLGIAGTVESQLIKKGHTVLESYRGGLYVGMGLSSAGILIALIFCRVPAASSINAQKKRSETNDIGTVFPKTNICSDVTQSEEFPGQSPMVSRF